MFLPEISIGSSIKLNFSKRLLCLILGICDSDIHGEGEMPSWWMQALTAFCGGESAFRMFHWFVSMPEFYQKRESLKTVKTRKQDPCNKRGENVDMETENFTWLQKDKVFRLSPNWVTFFLIVQAGNVNVLCFMCFVCMYIERKSV